MNRYLVTLTLGIGFSLADKASAFSVRTVSAATAQGDNGAVVSLEVAPGKGLNLNFIPAKETIKKAWIDDPSQITLNFDGNLCQINTSNGDRQSSCSNEGATVVHLRRIKPINFPSLPRSSDGSTLLTIITEGANGRKLYQFKVVPVKSEPKYTTVTISPNPQQFTPLVQQQLEDTSTAQWHEQVPLPQIGSNFGTGDPNSRSEVVTARTTSTTPVTLANTPTTLQATKESYLADGTNAGNLSTFSNTKPISRTIAKPPPTKSSVETDLKTRANPVAKNSPGTASIAGSKETNPQQTVLDAQAARQGLKIANRIHVIEPLTVIWWRTTRAISFLEEGDSIGQAAQKAELSPFLLLQLVSWGRTQSEDLVSLEISTN